MKQEIIFKGLRSIYRKLVNPTFIGNSWPEEQEWENTNKLIKNYIDSQEPCLIGRIGTSECAILVNYITVHSNKSYFKKCLDYIIDETRMPIWDTGKPFYDIQNASGFFVNGNIQIKDVEKFAEIYLKVIPTMDVCGRFFYQEKFLPFSTKCQMVQLESLYPFFSNLPWSQSLENRKVLVVHPFKDSIISQYNTNRKKLFKNPKILPDFELDVIQAVQTIAGEKSRFQNWFEALDYMKSEISKRNFDILIVGCGAYGLPLAAYGKSLGKKAIHLGGGTQLLFGIKGKRWEGKYHGDDTRFSDLFNDYWVYPSKKERPQNANKVEGGCYW